MSAPPAPRDPSSPFELDRAKLAAARLWASARMPYLAAAIFACEIVAETGTGTVSIDQGWRLHADVRAVEKIDVPELGRLVIHLCGHVVRGHGDRAQAAGVKRDIDRARWTRCADAEINDDLPLELVARSAPDTPHTLGFEAGRLAEAYYEPTLDGFRRWDCGSGADGAPRPGEDETGRGIGPQARKMLALQVALEIHSQEAREPGSVPGGWRRWAELMLPSRVDWRRMLGAEVRRAVARAAGQVDYSYRRPARRADLTPDLVLAAMHRPLPEIAIVCDTSNSMHDELLGRALAEIEAVLRKTGLRNRQVRVLAVDTTVQAVQRVSRALQLELAGGGGTEMGVGIAAAAALTPRPSIIVVLTDGFTSWPEQPPRGIPVIVGLLEQRSGPGAWRAPDWARVIEIEEAQ